MMSPVIALGFATLPVVTIATCLPGGKPSYQDITSLYFRARGVMEPIAIHRRDPVQRTVLCLATVAVYASPTNADKGGSPYCVYNAVRGDDPAASIGAWDSAADEPPQLIFDRLLSVLVKDRFYEIVNSPRPTESDGAAFYSIAVMRCGAQPHRENVPIAFVGPPRAVPNTSILALSIPFGSVPEAAADPKILQLFDDFTRTIYQSRWTAPDVY